MEFFKALQFFVKESSWYGYFLLIVGLVVLWSVYRILTKDRRQDRKGHLIDLIWISLICLSCFTLLVFLIPPVKEIKFTSSKGLYESVITVKCSIDYDQMDLSCINFDYEVIDNPMTRENTQEFTGKIVEKTLKTFDVPYYIITYLNEENNRIRTIVSKEKFDEQNDMFKCKMGAIAEDEGMAYCFD